jgi:hypothetical protein
VGTYEKTYLVAGVAYELYAQSEQDEVGFNLFDQRGRKVTVEPLPQVPDHEAVIVLVRRWPAVVGG